MVGRSHKKRSAGGGAISLFISLEQICILKLFRSAVIAGYRKDAEMLENRLRYYAFDDDNGDVFCHICFVQ